MITSENFKLDLAQQELVFIPKDNEPCEECDKKSDIQISLPLYTQDEFLRVLEILKKYKISKQEQEYVYNFYNRVFKTNKSPGCAKCLRNIVKHLQARYNRDYP